MRFLTVAGELFVPMACAIGAVVSAARGRLAASAACLVMLAAICLNPDLERFASIGHTPVYWPLLALLVWLVVARTLVRRRDCAGAARRRQDDHGGDRAGAPHGRVVEQTGKIHRHARARDAGGIVPFLPFAIWDVRALSYALYGSYQNVIKGFVWTSTTWAQHTIGITGVMLSNGLQRFVDACQAFAMLAVYFACWRAMRRGRPPAPWMGLALLTFSMTTLWPVTYVYFDVLLLLVAAVLADAMTLEPAGLPSLAGSWTTTAAATVALVVGSAASMLPDLPEVDAGTADGRPSCDPDLPATSARAIGRLLGRRPSCVDPAAAPQPCAPP